MGYKRTTRIAALVEEVTRAARDQNLTRRELAALSGLHENTLAGFGHPKRQWSPRIATLAALEAVLLPPIKVLRLKKPVLRKSDNRGRKPATPSESTSVTGG